MYVIKIQSVMPIVSLWPLSLSKAHLRNAFKIGAKIYLVPVRRLPMGLSAPVGQAREAPRSSRLPGRPGSEP